MEITKEEKAKLRYGSYYALSGLVLLGFIIYFEKLTGNTIPFFIDILYVIGFFVFIIGLALYQFFLYLDNFDK